MRMSMNASFCSMVYDLSEGKQGYAVDVSADDVASLVSCLPVLNLVRLARERSASSYLEKKQVST